MKTVPPAVVASLVLLTALPGQSGEPASAALPSDPTPAVQKQPLSSLPYTPSLEPRFMDRAVDPCTDFYTYSCGGWVKQNPIPPDQARWSVYAKLADDNQQYLWGILNDVSRSPKSNVERQIGDAFAACMDEATIEKLGAAPLAKDLAAIERITGAANLPAWLGEAHQRLGLDAPFGLGAGQDPGNSEQVIAWISAGGLGLPDRDYYTKTDAKSVEIRARYAQHIEAILTLAGSSAVQARRDAQTALRIETVLANASLTRVELRDPYKTYHKLSLADLQALAPSFDWRTFVQAAGAQGLSTFNVTEPKFFTALDKLLTTEKPEDLRAYLRWHVISSRADQLSSPFVKEHFAFYRAYLRGVQQMKPRWKRCVGWVDGLLGEALGQVFVERVFPPAVKGKTLDMVQRIEKAMEQRIADLPWMTAPTKVQAQAKLATLRNKIGYPDKWRDYSSLQISRTDFVSNTDHATQFETLRQLQKIGKPVDRGEWDMTPPTVNAYYNPSMNDMNFPAGVLLPPLFDPALDDAPNYGNTGGTIGHELVHGFDDEGRQYDAKGNLRNWWTPRDGKQFEARAQCISKQYASYVIVDDIKINSQLTLGEDVADLGGLVLAWQAWKQATQGQTLEARDGLTPPQRFFVGFAQWTCENQRMQDKRVSALTNPHSPGIYRVNGVVANMPEFHQAFSCKPNAPLRSKNPCKVW